MNTSQVKDTISRIENFNQLEIKEIFSDLYKGQDIDNIKIGEYTIPEYISTLIRLFKQLKIELEENGQYLPFQYNFNNEFGSGTLDNDIQSILNLINSRNINNIPKTIGFIKRLIYYQIINGFWDRSNKKIHSYNEIKTISLNNELKTLEKLLTKNAQEIKKQISSLENEKKTLSNFVITKKEELQQIKNNLQSTNESTQQVSKLLNTSTSTNEKINSILQQQTKNYNDITKKIEELNKYTENQKQIFKDLKDTINDDIRTFDEQITIFDEKLKFVESKKDFFEERNRYLTELIGREVGVSLFETFKQRKLELEKPVKNWLKIVILMAILTFIAIIAIFTNAFGYLGEVPNEISVIRLITNSIKTLPFFFLLFYSISQYNKERNFQEEYAFKSAVALTIKAYSDIINKEELKDDLILSSVSSVYNSPSIYKNKKSKEENTILETAKDLLSTALDVIKKK